MELERGDGKSQYGPGVSVKLSGDEVATAIDAYLVAHGVHVSGPRTVLVSNELCTSGEVFVDPSGYVMAGGERHEGRWQRDDAVPERPTPAPTERDFMVAMLRLYAGKVNPAVLREAFALIENSRR